MLTRQEGLVAGAHARGEDLRRQIEDLTNRQSALAERLLSAKNEFKKSKKASSESKKKLQRMQALSIEVERRIEGFVSADPVRFSESSAFRLRANLGLGHPPPLKVDLRLEDISSISGSGDEIAASSRSSSSREPQPSLMSEVSQDVRSLSEAHATLRRSLARSVCGSTSPEHVRTVSEPIQSQSVVQHNEPLPPAADSSRPSMSSRPSVTPLDQAPSLLQIAVGAVVDEIPNASPEPSFPTIEVQATSPSFHAYSDDFQENIEEDVIDERPEEAVPEETPIQEITEEIEEEILSPSSPSYSDDFEEASSPSPARSGSIPPGAWTRTAQSMNQPAHIQVEEMPARTRSRSSLPPVEPTDQPEIAYPDSLDRPAPWPAENAERRQEGEQANEPWWRRRRAPDSDDQSADLERDARDMV